MTANAVLLRYRRVRTYCPEEVDELHGMKKGRRLNVIK
jgi:hypothetical protein